jgi:hypothetical protein
MISARTARIDDNLGRGTDGSNPLPSSGESANFRSLSGGRIGVRNIASRSAWSVPKPTWIRRCAGRLVLLRLGNARNQCDHRSGDGVARSGIGGNSGRIRSTRLLTPRSRSAPGRSIDVGHAGAALDRPTCSSSDPIRWRPSADPGQKQTPATGSWLRGVDHGGPVTEGNINEPHHASGQSIG